LLLSLLFAFAVTQSPATLQQGLVALRDGNLSNAKTDFQQALKDDPKNPFAWVSLAETCRRLGDESTARDAAQKAATFGGTLPVIDHALAAFYTQEGQLARAAEFEEKYAESPKADPEAALRTAELYQRAGDRASAERVLKHLWQQRGSDPTIAFSYARILLQRLDFAAAGKAVAAAAEAHPDNAQLVLVQGVASYGQRRFENAIDSFLKVIAIDPAIPQPYEFIGKMLDQAGPRLPEITKAFAAHRNSAPDDALANLALAKAILAANAHDPEAETLLRHSIEIDPKQWESHFQLGVVLEGRHDFKAAAAELQQAIAFNPQEPMPHYHLARVDDRLGEPDQAAAERKLHDHLINTANK
jgi:Flp pilus assembly protein TadD